MSQVRDIVHNRELFSVEENETVAEVARRMAELHVGAIVVLKGGELSGVFSERDLMKRVVLERLDPEQTSVGRVMSTALRPSTKCRPSTTRWRPCRPTIAGTYR